MEVMRLESGWFALDGPTFLTASCLRHVPLFLEVSSPCSHGVLAPESRQETLA